MLEYAQLRATLDAAIMTARHIAISDTPLAGGGGRLLQRLEDNQRELERFQRVRTLGELRESHPFWMEQPVRKAG
jgi:hypothetical protein